MNLLSNRLPARLVQLATIAAAAAMMSACAAPEATTIQPAQVTTPATPAPNAAPAATAAQLLTQYTWNLDAVTGPSGKPLDGWILANQPAPVLQFQTNQVGVQNLCNLVNAGYTLNLDKIEMSRPMSTMRACIDEAKMIQERKIVQQLQLAQRFDVFPAANGAPNRLVLQFSDGVRWDLTGSPTPATRFGSAGERMFLEVGPEKVSCNHPLMRDAKCLRVRDIAFDSKGIKHVKGDWRIMQGSIEGYTFEPGIRNVLRVNRYSMANKNGVLPADAPSHAYVLDMVVESERMR